MAPSPSAEPLAPIEAEELLDLAEGSVVTALAGGVAEPPPPIGLSPALRSRRGAFVTLTVAGELNGCIGRVAGDEPLAHAVVRLARAAAFDDPRLPPLRADDLAALTIEVSVLSALTPLEVDDRAALASALRPARDGVVVASGRAQGLFLPAVWRQLPDPDDFLDALWVKAGWPPGWWPHDLRVRRFTTEQFHRHRT